MDPVFIKCHTSGEAVQFAREALGYTSHLCLRPANPEAFYVQVRTRSRTGNTQYLAAATLNLEQARETRAALDLWIKRQEAGR